MKRIFLVILIILVPLITLAQDYFDEAQWIGAITRKDAIIPTGRHYSGNIIKQTKAEWDKADPLSHRSIILRRSFKPYKTVKHAELRICGLGFYEATINGQKVGESEFAPTWSDYDKTVFFNTYDVTRQPTMSPDKSSRATTSYVCYWVMDSIMNKVDDIRN